MKVVWCLLIVLPLVLTTDKRFILGDLVDKLVQDIDFKHLKDTINKILDKIGSNSTASQCVTACTQIATKDILDAGCPLFCSGFQLLVQKLHIEDDTDLIKLLKHH
ncbi:hypothetical protein SNE40_022892 [Patella caerulea]|uniref:Uncharacterized protein n=1 Tax=Patella caerulea TaxID=87958 RepID=A0AAN8IWB8_PATCE